MTDAPGKLPVSAAKQVADRHDLRQCLLIGWDGEQVHVVTYGKTKRDCENAARAQEFWTGKIREFSFRGHYGLFGYLPPTDADAERVARAFDPSLWERLDRDINGGTLRNAAILARNKELDKARAAITALLGANKSEEACSS